MTTAIICDDEPRLAQALRDLLKAAWPELNVLALGQSGGEALGLIAEHEPDIAFLDIRMPGLSGLEVARQVVSSDAAPRIVFVTAYDQHAIEAFEARALDYLLKPVKAERLAETVTRLKVSMNAGTPTTVDQKLVEALRQISTVERKFLRWLNCGQGSEIDVIATSEVLFFQSRDKYTAVITADKERYVRTPIRDLLNELDPDEFWQVHRSSVIRVAAIERVLKDDVGRMRVKLRGTNELVPVSAAFTGRFRQM
ncbi:MAG: LytR/AlgR family response regulator transcription factor [Burkholderiales bacterium]|jgi:DNA-binding LytR/AlgR family response regulator|nr:response regulator transcription factor [Rhodocyclaceae bacterium]MCA3018038.1 response regulator transcription factor [Rhodocyclaceae bacterium]MCA3021263.1 response regulator transcription factor [Rhodocyclaceae bacterium]MCA3026088.1 response regulator transcription factor [Rhodocyclaceae bacterium]MCA3031476.1 response regulator transcription factor [Rhodocyclaceae bacterium]